MMTLTETDQQTVMNRLVEISLFTWRRAETDDPVDDDERYGWWGDSYPAVNNQKIGSRLWLLKRRKLNQDTVLDARHYINEAMQWLVDDKLIKGFEVDLQIIGLNQLKSVVIVELLSNEKITTVINDIWGMTQNAF